MTSVFGPAYAGAYDLVYADKDYAQEVGIIERLGAAHLRPGPWSVLDLGCGTGRHAVALAARGHNVVGIDRAPDMLARARDRAHEAGHNVEFLEGDVRDVRVGRRFDLVLLMFAVLGYQLTDDDVAATLETAGAHLDPGGLLTFDVWYQPAVEAIGPSTRVREIPTPDGVLERRATGRLNGDGTCTVEYELVQAGGELRALESHRMRYFSTPELEALLDGAGFQLVALHAFPDMTEPTEETWNVIATARKVSRTGRSG